MRSRRLLPLVLTILALAPGLALAAGWSAVPLPHDTGLGAVSCTSSRWCMALGGWDNTYVVGQWTGTRWLVSARGPNPKGADVTAVSCRSRSSCVAVGGLFPRESRPVDPLVETWNGHRWSAQTAPKPAPPKGYRATNAQLDAVACPGAKLCFAVGQEVPFGAGDAPGVPLIERWNGSRWTLVDGPTAGSPLTSISCPSTRVCIAVGGFEHTTGTANANNQQLEYPNVVEFWNGRSWSLGSVSLPSGMVGAGLLGVSCAQVSKCLAIGNGFDPAPGYAPGNDGGNDQAIAAAGNRTTFSASALAFPPSVYRSPSAAGTATTVLTTLSCATATSCAAVGNYVATNGAIGPLAATWNGSTWDQIALRRGPVQLSAVSCPTPQWCMAVGGDIAERWTG